MITHNLFYTILLFFLYGFQYMLVPAIALYPDLKDHSLGYRVLFYQISALCYISFVSFALSFIHIYTSASTWICFVIVPVGVRLFRERKVIRAGLSRWFEGYKERKTYTESLKSRRRRYRKSLKPMASFLYRNYLKGHLFQYLTCAIIVYMICAKFGYFHLTHYSYECSDEPTHIYWVTNLIKGNPFPAGLYPHGMHFIVGGLCIMFGLEVMRAWLCFGMISLTIVFLSGFLVTEKIFHSKFAALAGVILLIIGKGLNTGWVSRLNWVMPMELAMFAVFIMMYGLICWIQDSDKKSLLMFGMGVLGTTLIHVFATIAAFFVVVAFVLVFGIRMIREKRFLKFFLCGFLAVVLAVVPYVVGLACGYELEQSFSWGMSIFGTKTETQDESDSGSTALESTNAGSESTNNGSESSASETADSATAAETQDSSEPSTENTVAPVKVPLKDKIIDYKDRIVVAITEVLVNNEDTAYAILASFLFTGAFGFLGLLTALRNKSRREHYAVILFAALAWLLVFVTLYLISRLGIITIMSTTRSAVFVSFLMIPLIAAPFGFIAGIVGALARLIHLPGKYPDELAMLAASIVCIVFIIRSGEPLYQDLVYTFVMEEQDIKAEEQLINEAEDFTWTFVSTTNARLGILSDGYHYEITDVLLACRDKDTLYIPTKDIYIAVEKKVNTADERHVDGRDYLTKTHDISATDAASPLSDFIPVVNGKVDSKVYLNDTTRIGIMSHFYYWMEKIKTVYPNEVSIYTQDETCTVYHISQDPYFLLNLAVDYSDLVEEALNSDTMQ